MALNGFIPYKYIGKMWISEPKWCFLDPIHQMLGLNSSRVTCADLFSLIERCDCSENPPSRGLADPGCPASG
ncbi:MAG: hypothetical protein ACI87T_003922 [Planctomycetota bacterium]|jgi:hypothetical protein